jgi:hypothetical protein
MALARFVPFAGFGEFPLQLPDAAFSVFDFPKKFACINGCTTFGADITITFEAVCSALALVPAVRARNLDGFFIEHGRIALYFPFTSMVPEDAGCSAVRGCPDTGLCCASVVSCLACSAANRFALCWRCFLCFSFSVLSPIEQSTADTVINQVATGRSSRPADRGALVFRGCLIENLVET